jgi:hypothetical protein
MKEIKHVSFNEIILIPARDKFEEDYPLTHYAGQLNGSNGDSSSTVHVMLFNCSNIIETVALVDLEISNLKDYISKNPEVKEITSQIEFFSNLKGDIENPCLHHDPPKELIDYLSHKGFELDKNNLIFLSGISSLVEV